jgi:hypothetical protein
MRSHLGCTGSVSLGDLSVETRKRLEQIEASWLEFSPEPASLVVRHVQPDDAPAMREVAGELLDFLHAITDAEREQIPGGAFYYCDEPTGQFVRLRVWSGGFLTVEWARPDYTQGREERYRNQPVDLVFEPFQKLNGKVRFEGSPTAGDELRRILEGTAGEYSQGDYAISSSVNRTELTLNNVNADVRSLVNGLRYLARAGTLLGAIDVSSFRMGDVGDYCRFVFRQGETFIQRPRLWCDAPEPAAFSPAEPAAA